MRSLIRKGGQVEAALPSQRRCSYFFADLAMISSAR